MEEKEMIQESPREEERFKKGVLVGILATVAVFLFAVLIVISVVKDKYAVTLIDKEASDTQEVLDADSEKKIKELLGQMELYYYEDIDTEELTNGLYKGLFEGLGDPYSVYYTKEEYDSMMVSTSGTYCGIGAVLSQDMKTMQVTVLHVYKDTPADKAGLKDGDTILKVDDIEATSMELSELVTNIRGDKGTKVHLEVYREGEKDKLEYDIERDKVEVPTVEYEMLENNVGYIQITEFAEPTETQFMEAVNALQAQGMQAMIVDLRDNPGGYLSAVTEILDDILPEGITVYTEDKYGKRQNYTSDDEHRIEIPMAVLINENSASAAEIFAGAIKDYDYGTLIGTKSFGKGIVQTVKQLKDGSAIKLTTAKYYTPNGNYIHEVGIEPDVELEYEYTGDTNEDYDKSQDNQIQKALEILESDVQNK
ncbi:MAG: S41 family peptidase [Lachnospiraceae bacterium]|nr:S41 family peptidase [Lachnospiraceae bacterium]MDD7379072.1 S41 family peptidase [Lachnospiraceae bacterium]MDY4616488.1 S41 family peptidase [Lachnospiraceae bacterium]